MGSFARSPLVASPRHTNLSGALGIFSLHRIPRARYNASMPTTQLRYRPRVVSSSEPMVNLNARIPKDLWRRLRLRCLTDGRLLRAVITEALEDHLVATRKR